MMSKACWPFAPTARKDDISPMARTASCRIRGGLEKIWRGFPQAVPDFAVEIAEIIPGEEDTVVVQALLGGTMPADVPGLVKKGEVGRIAHAYIIRYDTDGKISHLDCYWDNTAINAIKASGDTSPGLRRHGEEQCWADLVAAQ
jgi:hypothetical protein